MTDEHDAPCPIKYPPGTTERLTRRMSRGAAVLPDFSRIEWIPGCSRELRCGGGCVLATGHLGPCECGGDEPGCPGSCPA